MLTDPQEIDVLLSSTTPSSLIPVLPYVFVTKEIHAVSPSTVTTFTNDVRPETAKLYWASAVESAKTELRHVQDLGPAAIEEWFKGLEARGKESRNDASRWERWVISGGLADMHKFTNSPFNTTSEPSSNMARPRGASLQADSHEKPSAQNHIITEGKKSPAAEQQVDAATKSISTPSRSVLSMNAQRTEFRARPERSPDEAARLKALRRSEVERRAMLINPPLPPNILVRIPSFQAAIQIITPLNDYAWDLLESRLPAQRAEAKKVENESLVKTPLHGIATNDLILEQVSDQDWDNIQGPVRTKMAKYANEMIRHCWNKGRKVNKENSPRFAADVLLSVRTRFYAGVKKDRASAVAAGQEPSVDHLEGPFTQKPTLENIKWVFDMKIKAHIEPWKCRCVLAG
ncbi:hypothetical protein CPLU01_01446 [Colletotrichum plurivorum]|uniref:Uncharacterized protein n=1 Tax=Colletotrichum plurivorum TaxID=2175906 RepID=A0A8H6U466_9PEZI|nr:hypothetical protein CPLU01_01446 [Colletotrichum plurivorum]